jgi:pyruvate-formate lyase-activating enzyme
MNKDSFCVLPHIHQMARQDGSISLCCNAIDLGRQKDSPIKSWSSDYMQKVRSDLSNGKKISQCTLCWDREDKGFSSMRQEANNEYGMDDSTLATPKYLDLRLSNLCNLKCRMCNPVYSSQIAKEYSITDQTWYDEFVTGEERDFKIKTLQEVKPQMWEEFKTYIPGLEKLYFTGGEPTLVPQVKEYLQECIDTGHAQHIKLVFTTNLTNINQDILEMCDKFANVHWGTSIDGYGELNNYIRSNSNWSTVDKNLKSLMKSKFSVGVHPTVCIYNILHITELLEYVEGLWDGRFMPYIFLNLLQTPDYLSFQYLPEDIKMQASKKLQRYVVTSKYCAADSSHKHTVMSIIRLLKNSTYDRDKLSTMKRFNEQLDKNRKTKLEQILPEIYECVQNL